MAIRKRKKPVAPKRKMISVSEDLDSFANVQELIDWVTDQPVEADKIQIKDTDGWGGYLGEVRYSRKETNEEFQERMYAYEQKLASWNEWYDANKDAIEEAEKNKQEALKLKNLAEMERLEKSILKLREKQAALQQ